MPQRSIHLPFCVARAQFGAAVTSLTKQFLPAAKAEYGFRFEYPDSGGEDAWLKDEQKLWSQCLGQLNSDYLLICMSVPVGLIFRVLFTDRSLGEGVRAGPLHD